MIRGMSGKPVHGSNQTSPDQATFEADFTAPIYVGSHKACSADAGH